MSVVLPKPPVPHHWLLDANVLFSEWSRGLMFILARTHQAQLHWTPTIEHECYRNLVRLGRLHPEDAALEQARLPLELGGQLYTDDAQAYLADVKAVDEKDRHVAASALALRHRLQAPVALLTWNIKDFPRKPLLKLGLVRYTPDELFTELIQCPVKASHTLQAAAGHLQSTLSQRPRLHPTAYEQAARPLPNTRQDWLEFLGRNRQHKTARLLQRAQNDS
ncbi:PIN domain-containing protein [Limnobacter sp.]|uniref:PIN domain-containing protein n=1 Tax=Limnobacter sp. TaxID=2003368 RepID=UPI003516913F